MNVSEALQNSTTAATNEVEWNTIFYTLLPLAMSTMTQPVGSVLGTNPISRTYLRSSPIFCGVDTLQLIVEIVLLRIFYFYTFRGAAVEARERRFQHVTNENDSLNTSQAQAVIRWVFFLLGTHGCLLKLAGAKGIPWSKTCGFIYLSSFVVFEIMLLIKPIPPGQWGRGAKPNYHHPDAIWRALPPPEFLQSPREAPDTDPRYDTRRTDPLFHLVVDIPVDIGFCGAYLATCALVGVAVGILTSEVIFRLGWYSFHDEGNDDYASWKNVIMPYLVYLLVYLPAVIVQFFLAFRINTYLVRVIRRRPVIGERLLILDCKQAASLSRLRTQVEAGETLEGFHITSLLAFWLCLINFILGFLLCKLWYDPAGTVRATWADVFG